MTRAVLLGLVLPVAIGLTVVLVLATTPWGNERVRRIVVSQANDRLTGHLSIGRMRGNLLSGATLTNVSVVDSVQRPVFTARRVRIHYGLWAALQRRVVIESLVLDTAAVVFDKRPGERWNFQALMRPSGTAKDTSRHGAPPKISEVTIHDSRFTWRSPWEPDSTLPADKRDAAIAAALGATARSRTERVPGGFQRVLSIHDITAELSEVYLAREGQPTSVRIAALSMIAEPYHPPVIDVRSLTGTIYASKDSLWWHDVRMTLPSSQVASDGRIAFNRSGITLHLSASPLAFADFRWLNPKLPTEGGGRLAYAMSVHGDTAEYSVTGVDIRYRDATVVGGARLARIHPADGDATVLVRDADVTVSRLGMDLVRQLAPSVRLPRDGTIDGHLAVSGPLDALDVNADVRVADPRSGTSHVMARGGLALAHGIAARELNVKLLPLHLALLDAVGVRSPIGGTLSGSALVDGSPRAGWDVRADLIHVDRGARSHVTGKGRYRTASRHIEADATLQPLALATLGRFAPTAELRGSVTGRIHARGTTRALQLSGDLRSTDGGGSLHGRGTVALHGRRTRYDVAMALDVLNASVFSRRAPNTRLTGTIAARGNGVSPTTATAEISAHLIHSRYDTFAVDRLTARVGLSNGLLRADTVVAVASGATARASGTLGLVAGRDGTMHVALAADSLGALRRWLGSSDSSRVGVASGRQSALLVAARADSARKAEASRIERLALGLPPGVELVMDTLVGIPRDSLAGSLLATATLRGNLKRLGVEARTHGRDIVVRGNAAARVDAELSSIDVRDRAASLMVEVNADSVQTGGYAFEQVHALGNRRDGRITAELRVRQDSLVSYAALGRYDHPAAGVQIVQFDSLSARFDTLVWRLAHPGAVQLDHGTITIDSIDLRSSSGGRLVANGVVPKQSAVRLDVAAEGVRVSTVLRALQRTANADGVLSASVLVAGSRVKPEITGRLLLRDASYQGERTPDGDVDFRYAAQRLVLDGSARDSSGRKVLAATASLPLDLALERLTGSRRIAGPLVADIALDSLRLSALPLSTRAVTDVRGSTAGEVHVRGGWKAPVFTGYAVLRDGGITLVSTGLHLTDAIADLRLARDTLRLDSLVARARGTLRASGTVDLTDRSRPFVSMSAVLRDLRVMDAQRGLVDADGELSAMGPLDAVRVTGRAEMLRGFLALKQFRKDLLRVKAPRDLTFFTNWDTTSPAAGRARSAAARAQPRRFGMIADLALQVDRGNYYRNKPDVSTGFFTGDREELRAHIDTRSSDAWAVGFVRIGGGIAIFRARRFTPARGTLTFSSFTGGPGMVEQVGEHNVWEPGRGVLPLQLLTGGTSKAPAIGLEAGSLFPIRGRELNGYLTMGRDHTSLLQQSGSSLSGSASWSGQLSGETGALAHRQQAATALGVVLHDIGTGAAKEFSLDAFSVSPADVPTELVFGKTGGVRGALIEGGRFVTVDRYIGGEFRLTRGIPGARLSQRFGSSYQLDIGIEPRFLFHAPEDLGITHPTVRTGVFGTFLTRTWDW